MRVYSLILFKYSLGVSIAFVLGCGPRPVHKKWPDHVSLPPAPEKPTRADETKALWFTTSNYATGGTLGRLDLTTGAINRTVMTVGSDTQIFPDTDQGLFLLNRMIGDGVTVLKGASAQVSGFYSLNKGSNPQQALRDHQGRVWVSMLESNDILVLSPDLQRQEASISLENLKVPDLADAMPNLAQLYQVDDEHMMVTAQRIHRFVRAWKPDAQSGLAVINTKSLMVDFTQLLSVPNPIQLGRSQNKLVIVGGGDFSTREGLSAKLAHFESPSFAEGNFNREIFTEGIYSDIDGKILAADLSVGSEAPAMIVWYPKENKSCVQVGLIKVICEGSSLNEGYVFNAIRRLGSRIFVAYYGADEAQLWILTTGESASLQKIPMDLPIVSMSGGL